VAELDCGVEREARVPRLDGALGLGVAVALGHHGELIVHAGRLGSGRPWWSDADVTRSEGGSVARPTPAGASSGFELEEESFGVGRRVDEDDLAARVPSDVAREYRAHRVLVAVLEGFIAAANDAGTGAGFGMSSRRSLRSSHAPFLLPACQSAHYGIVSTLDQRRRDAAETPLLIESPTRTAPGVFTRSRPAGRSNRIHRRRSSPRRAPSASGSRGSPGRSTSRSTPSRAPSSPQASASPSPCARCSSCAASAGLLRPRRPNCDRSPAVDATQLASHGAAPAMDDRAISPRAGRS
jgi:hypothetical protein